MASTLKSETVEALRNLLDIVVPEFSLFGYNKETAINEILKRAQEDPLITKMRLYVIYTQLKKLNDKGELLK